VVEAAVAASPGRGTLLLAPGNSGRNRLASNREPAAGSGGTGTVPVRVVTLAAVVAEAGLGRIDCLKVDVEGREADVIKPYMRVAPRSGWPRRLIVELAHARGGRGTGRAELESWIVARGYRLVRRTKLNGVFTLVKSVDDRHGRESGGGVGLARRERRGIG